MEGTVVVDLTDDVDLVVACIGRNLYRDNRLVWLFDSSFCCADLSLLPPQKSKMVTIWVC